MTVTRTHAQKAAARSSAAPLLAPVTHLGAWKARHSRPVVIDYLRWHQAIETTLRANTEAALTLGFIWPRILLRTLAGV